MAERRLRTRYEPSEALQFILEPGSGSEMSDLSDDDDAEYLPVVEDVQPTSDEVVVPIQEEDTSSLSNVSQDSSNNTAQSSSTSNAQRNYRWRKTNPPAVDTTFLGEKFSDHS